MATKFESYEPAVDFTTNNITGNTWIFQTFTPSVTHKLTSVLIFGFRADVVCGDLIVYIRAVDGEHKPTGGDLCTDSIDANGITINTDGEWIEIPIADGYEVQANTEYVIIIRHSVSENVNWRGHAAGYSGGLFGYTTNAGSSWGTNSDFDQTFQEWGDAVAAPTGGAGAAAELLLAGQI